MRISRIPQLPKKRLAAAGVSLAIAGTLLGAGLTGTAHAAAGAAQARTQAAGPGVKPTIVLVHGAFADNSSWDAVVVQLQRLGYTVDVPPNPLRGVSYDSAYLSDFLSTISGPVVLVAHSYGGFVITNVGASDPEVKALVYVDSYLPVAGDTLNSLNSAVPGSCITPAILNAVPFPAVRRATRTCTSRRVRSPAASRTACRPLRAPRSPPSSSRWHHPRRTRR